MSTDKGSHLREKCKQLMHKLLSVKITLFALADFSLDAAFATVSSQVLRNVPSRIDLAE